MKVIPKTFRKGGFDYTHIKREGRIGMFLQKEAERLIGIEVVVIKQHKKDVPKYNIQEGDERYPSNSDFGNTGWSYGASNDKQLSEALKVARSKFDELVKVEKRKKK
jgi:hypothetical protein